MPVSFLPLVALFATAPFIVQGMGRSGAKAGAAEGRRVANETA